MRILSALLAIGAIVIGLVVAPQVAERLEIGNRYQRERNLLELERSRYEQQRREQWDTLTIPSSVVLQYAAYGLLIVAGALVLRYANDGRTRRSRDHELISVAGLPVPRRVLEAGDPELLDLMADALRADKVRAIEEARRALPPHTLTVAPRYANTNNGAETAALPATSPVLPDIAPLADILDTLPKNQLAYGMLPGNEPLLRPLASGYHILGHGDTRSGKTTFLDGLLVELHHKAPHFDIRLIAGDFKRELAATWERSPLMEAVETDPTAIAEMLETLVRGDDGVLDRYEQFKALGERSGRIIRNYSEWCGATGERPRLVFVTVDELNAVLEAAGKKANLSGALKIALQTGAGSGIFIMGGAQYLDSSTFGRAGSKQFVTRAHFGAWDPTAIRVMFGEKLPEEQRALLTGQPGRGLIRTAGQTSATPFQSFKCDEDDILGAIRLLSSDQPAIEMPAKSATSQQPRNASATAATDCANLPATAEIVRRLRSQGMGKTKVIELVWGVKPGGGSASYKAASAAYDAIFAEVAR